MSKLQWIGIAIVACLISFGAGWATKKTTHTVEERIVEKVVERIVEIEKKQQQRTVSTTKTPDGTTTTTVTDTNTEVAVRKSEKAIEKSSEKARVYQPNYSVGASATTDFTSLTPSYRVEAGYRVLGNAWATTGYSLKSHELSLGLRIDF